VNGVIGAHVPLVDGNFHLFIIAAHFRQNFFRITEHIGGDHRVFQGSHYFVKKRKVLQFEGINNHFASGINGQIAFSFQTNNGIPEWGAACAQLVAYCLEIKNASR
jgi:hypothetical protein